MTTKISNSSQPISAPPMNRPDGSSIFSRIEFSGVQSSGLRRQQRHPGAREGRGPHSPAANVRSDALKQVQTKPNRPAITPAGKSSVHG